MDYLEEQTTIIWQNLQVINRSIAEALAASGREESPPQLVVITKGRSDQQIRAAYRTGLRAFGENRVEEALPKQAALVDLDDVTWHMVGKIQSRKTKEVALNFSCVHSIDRLKIARLLEKHREGTPERIRVFIEGNFSGEQSKSGFTLDDPAIWQERISELSEIMDFPHLALIGVMTMAPWQVDHSLIRDTFRKAREFRDLMAAAYRLEGLELSMGMTDDYPIAIEEGATVLRLGRVVFDGL